VTSARPAPVLVNGAALWPPVTGVQRVTRGLTRQLLAEAEPGEVEVLGGPPDFGGRGDRVLGGRVGRVVWEQSVLPALARGADVLMNLGQTAPLASRRNLVLTYDLHLLRLPGHYRTLPGRTYWGMVVQAYRRARYRVTLSRTIARDLEQTLGGEVHAVIPPGIDEAFRPSPPERVEEIRRRLHLDVPYLTLVGWSQPAKRAWLAVEAHRLLVADVPHRLVLVGARLPDFSRVNLGPLPPSVVMAGPLSDADLAALHTGSSGLLFPSEYEGFGLPPVEALACGAPVAASSIPVLQEVLSELPAARLIESSGPEIWKEAAAALLSDRGSREASSAAAIARYPWAGKGRALLTAAGR
jgi:glycosyltransferase involved in cell wall biosynthesis